MVAPAVIILFLRLPAGRAEVDGIRGDIYSLGEGLNEEFGCEGVAA